MNEFWINLLSEICKNKYEAEKEEGRAIQKLKVYTDRLKPYLDSDRMISGELLIKMPILLSYLQKSEPFRLNIRARIHNDGDMYFSYCNPEIPPFSNEELLLIFLCQKEDNRRKEKIESMERVESKTSIFKKLLEG